MDPLQKAKHFTESLPKTANVVEFAGPVPPGNEFLKTNNICLATRLLITMPKLALELLGVPGNHYLAQR